ncbi:MAG: hypothetical protein Tsb002_06560 [Wenzhouxiangellaceae bacterium]
MNKNNDDLYDELIAHRIRSSAEKAAKKLSDFIYSKRDALIDTDGQRRYYAYNIRVKSVKSILNKKKEKAIDRPDYKLTSISDIVGLRFITLFRSDLSYLVDFCISQIDAGGVFIGGSIEEGKIFTMDRRGDVVLSSIEEAFKNNNYKDYEIVPSRKSRYSSIHLLAKLDSHVDAVASQETAKLFELEAYKVPIEIQIRTVFEDAWGEIDHIYQYKPIINKARKYKTQSYFVPQHLASLKMFLDSCSVFADTIKQEAEITFKEKFHPEPSATVLTEEQAKQGLENIGVSRDIIIEILNARRERNDAILSIDDNGQEAISRLLQISKRFKEILDTGLDRIEFSKKEQKKYIAWCRAEEALTLFNTGIESELINASNIYQALIDELPGSAFLRYRYGRVLGQLNKHRDAISQLEEALRILDERPDNASSIFNEGAGKKIYPQLFRSLGYEYWKVAHDLRESNDRYDKNVYCKLVKNAYNITRKSVDEGHVAHSFVANMDGFAFKVINNLLYYSTLIAEEGCDNSMINDQYVDHAGRIESYLERYSSYKEGNNEGIEHLHTLMSANKVIGKLENAKKIAEKLEEMLLSRNYLDELHMWVLRQVRSVLVS